MIAANTHSQAVASHIGCGCACHTPNGLDVTHVAACCTGPPNYEPIQSLEDKLPVHSYEDDGFLRTSYDDDNDSPDY